MIAVRTITVLLATVVVIVVAAALAGCGGGLGGGGGPDPYDSNFKAVYHTDTGPWAILPTDSHGVYILPDDADSVSLTTMHAYPGHVTYGVRDAGKNVAVGYTLDPAYDFYRLTRYGTSFFPMRDNVIMWASEELTIPEYPDFKPARVSFLRKGITTVDQDNAAIADAQQYADGRLPQVTVICYRP